MSSNIDCENCENCTNCVNCKDCVGCKNCYGSCGLCGSYAQNNFIYYNNKYVYKIIGDFDVKSIINDESIEKALDDKLIVGYNKYTNCINGENINCRRVKMFGDDDVIDDEDDISDDDDYDYDNDHCTNCINCDECVYCKNCYNLQQFEYSEGLLFVSDYVYKPDGSRYQKGFLYKDINNVIDFNTATEESIKKTANDGLLKMITEFSFGY